MSDEPCACALEDVMRLTLAAFGDRILHTPRYGKEREVVSYNAFGCLAKAAFDNAPENR